MKVLNIAKRIIVGSFALMVGVSTAAAVDTETGCIELNDGMYAYTSSDRDDYFGVNRQVTRYEVATMIYNMLDKEYREGITPSNIEYIDLDEDTDGYLEIMTLSEISIISGYTDGSFRPSNTITRGELVNILVNIRNIPDNFRPKRTFLDVQDVYNRDAIEYAATNHWIRGYRDDTFRPDKPITKIETIIVLNRFLNREWDNDYDFTDLNYVDANKDAWYYKDLLMATGKIVCNENSQDRTIHSIRKR